MFGGFFEKLKSGLSKTKNGFTDKVSEMLNLYVNIDEELYEELEEILITSDIGVETTLEIIERLRAKVKVKKVKDPREVIPCLKEALIEMLGTEEQNDLVSGNPSVILVVGVNGVGKTTSI